jgi:hypothetical protein
MEEFRVPTTPIDVELQFVDGRISRGTVFVPASTPVDSWVGEATLFFPFRREGAAEAELVAKRSVVRLSFTPPAAPDPDTAPEVERCRVAIECSGGQFEGEILVDMPSHQRRLLDYINQPAGFVAVHQGGTVHLIQKRLVIRVVQKPSGDS